MLDALFSPDPDAWDNWARSQGFEPDPDLPVCLANVPREEWVELSKVLPSPAIQRYLDSGDTLTNKTIGCMEMAIERDYGVAPPWYIDCERSGREDDGDLAVDCFRLGKETEKRTYPDSSARP